MDVSIIIVNYNTCEITRNCIDSIYIYTSDVTFEIILVDNNSQDNSKIVFSNDTRIKYLYQTENLGFGKANNVGYQHAKGKYLFLLNSDTILKNNAVKLFFDYMENAKSNISCIGTLLTDKEGKLTTSHNKFPTLWTGFDWFSILGESFRRLGVIKDKAPSSKVGIVDYISGADIFMRKEVADNYGLFDPDFFMYFEETEMQYRYKKNGFYSMIYNIPQIIHLESYTVNQNSTNKNFTKQKMSLYSYYKYLYKCKGMTIYYLFRFLYACISPLWIIHPRYSLKEKIDFIKIAYQKK